MRAHAIIPISLVCVGALAGCLDVPGEADDAGEEERDRGLRDGGSDSDAGLFDAGVLDGGDVDGGQEPDAGQADAGAPDAGGDPGPRLCDDPSLHNGGDGVCVPIGTCSPGYTLRNDGYCTAWRAGASLPFIGRGTLVVDGDRVYSIGNVDEQGPGPPPVYAHVLDGEISQWIDLPPLPGTRIGAAAAVANGKLYVFGGQSSLGDLLGDVVSGDIDPIDGSISEWFPEPQGLTIPRAFAAAFFHGSSIFVSGGFDQAELYASIEELPVNPDGSLGSSTLVGATPDPVADHEAHVLAAGVVLTTGFSFSGATTWATSDTSFAGLWNTAAGISGLDVTCGVAIATHIAIFGGQRDPDMPGGLFSSTRKVHLAALSDNLEVGEWRPVGELDTPLDSLSCARVGEFFVIAGGRARTADGGDVGVDVVSVASIDAVLRSVEMP